MKDYAYTWDYTTNYKELERKFNINNVRYVDTKIRFTKNRLIKFKKWECTGVLNKLRNAGIDKLTAQLEFLNYVKDFKLKGVSNDNHI